MDTSTCRHVSILARAAVSFNLQLFVSPDGTTRILRGDPGATQANNVDGYATALAENLAIAEPFLQVQIQAANPTAWVWCQP